MPFERLMMEVSGLSEADRDLSMAELAGRWGEPVLRIMDAITAVRVLRGERTYIPAASDETGHERSGHHPGVLGR